MAQHDPERDRRRDPRDDFADLQAALDFHKTKLIAFGVVVTLSMRAEVHNYAATATVQHVHAHRIHIVGAPMAGAIPTRLDFTITGSDAAARAADAAANKAMLETRFATRIDFSAGQSFAVRNCHLGLLRDILIEGDPGAAGLSSQDKGSVEIDTVAVHGASTNINVIAGSSVTGRNLYGSGAVAGANLSLGDGCVADLRENVVLSQAEGNGLDIIRNSTFSWSGAGGPLRVQGSASQGVAISWSGSFYAAGVQCIQHAGNGLWCIGGSTAYVHGAFINNCGASGVHASQGSFVDANTTTLDTNVGTDYVAVHGAHIYVGGYLGAPTFSPAINVPGVDGAHISN